jgi:hypothetical protein
LSPENGDTKNVEVSLRLEEAEKAHAALERILEEGSGNDGDEKLELAYRRLGWRILAAKGGSGLTARLSEIARDAESLEQFERERDDELGPILEGLERGENRDP